MEAGENMITTLNIHNFRCFQDLSVTKLAPITLLGGRNNSGKSAILEANFFSFRLSECECFLGTSCRP